MSDLLLNYVDAALLNPSVNDTHPRMNDICSNSVHKSVFVLLQRARYEVLTQVTHYSASQILEGQNKPITQVWEEASALYVVNLEHAEMTLRKGHSPSLHCALTVALEHLCEIYATKEKRKPYILSASAKEEIFGPTSFDT